MAFFGVTLETIDKVWDHPNADKLSLASVKGLAFQFVIGKNQFAPGAKVLYFPLDAQLPLSLLERMNMVGKLSGKDKNRIKSIKLRGEISQGLVVPADKYLSEEQMSYSSEEITKFFGVTKYEPPVQMANDGILKSLPDGFSKYDIEGADRFGDIIELLMDQDVVVMEKMEGTNFSCVKTSESKIVVNQRNHTIEEKENIENSYWRAARHHNFLEKVSELPNTSGIYAELCGPGIQGNLYGLKEHALFAFDIKMGGKWMDFATFKNYTAKHGVKTAPILFVGKLKDFLMGKTIQEASNGFSVLKKDQLREGIVIKPLFEQYHSKLGRLIIKQRSPEYLCKYD